MFIRHLTRAPLRSPPSGRHGGRTLGLEAIRGLSGFAYRAHTRGFGWVLPRNGCSGREWTRGGNTFGTARFG